MYYPDLSHECQLARGPRVRAVGWLTASEPFTRGPHDPAVREHLQRLCAEGWVHVAAAGPHECELCRDAREARNVLVPSAEVLYVAPAMILHYMEVHAYLPPDEFSRAVLACPPPLSDAYDAALRRFREHFSPPDSTPMTEQAFDRCMRTHREHHAERARVDSQRKRFTWD